MKQVHFSMYGKGGTGKSLIASLIAQFLNVEKINPWDYDHGHEGNYDSLFNLILEKDDNFVIDSSPLTFLSFRHYMLESDAVNFLSNRGKQVVMHVPVTHNPNTHINLQTLLDDVPDTARIVVWLNEIYGKIEGFERTEIYLNNKERIHGIARLEGQQNSANTFGADIRKMLTKELTFDEAISSSDFGFMAKHRLRLTKEKIYRQIEAIA